MKRNLVIALFLMGAASFAAAQITTPTTDVLGAHLNYGRGCAACHAPHSGAYGNGAAKTDDPTSGNIALWGEDVGSLYSQTINTGQSGHFVSTSNPLGFVPETLPGSLSATTPDVSGVLMCLSCHDGNLASGAMTQNAVYETLPTTYGTHNTIPTLLGKDGTTAGNYLNDHPVGLNAVMTCGGTYDWDCSISSAGKVQMTGLHSAQFVTNYGFFVKPGVNASNQPVVLCTTCHNQHVMNVVKVTQGTITGGVVTAGNTGLPSGNYATMFFILAPYNPANGGIGNKTSNQTAQFCRQCHGGESNEMNGSTAATTF